MARHHQLKETDLYLPVRNFLEQQGYLVRSEVLDCDIVAAKADQLVIVELKLALNTTLLVQALKRQRLTPLVYVALPKPSPREWRRRWPGLKHLLRRLELGLLLVSFTQDSGYAEVVFDPGPYRERISRKQLQAVQEEMAGRSVDHNLGGSTRKQLLTAYREQALYIAWWLQQLGPQSPKSLRLMGTCSGTLSILYRNHYGWFLHLQRGMYALSDAGRKALNQYPDLVTIWQHQAEARNQSAELPH